MNDLDKILKLAELGYTKDEISALMGSSKPEEAKPEEQPKPEVKPEVKPETAPDPANILAETMKTYMESMNETLKAIQAANVNRSEMGAPNTPTAEDAMAAIIAPTRKKK